MQLDIKIDNENFTINGYIESISRHGFHGVFAFEEIESGALSIDYDNLESDITAYVKVLELELTTYINSYRLAIEKYKKLMIFI